MSEVSSAAVDDKLPMARRFRGFMPVVIDVECGGFNPNTDALLEIAAVLLEIQGDGVFFIRVNRDGGDFFVQDATVTIDGELARLPAPSTLALLFAACPGWLVMSRRRTGLGLDGVEANAPLLLRQK